MQVRSRLYPFSWYRFFGPETFSLKKSAHIIIYKQSRQPDDQKSHQGFLLNKIVLNRSIFADHRLYSYCQQENLCVFFINQIMIITSLLWIVTLLFNLTLQLNVQSFLAIQSQLEIYNSYIPFIDGCNYDAPNILEGRINKEKMDAADIFELVQDQNEQVFWIPVQNGLTIANLLGQNIPAEYSGYILYDSDLINQNRLIILYQLSQSYEQISFTYSFVTINISILKVSFSFEETLNISLTEDAAEMMKDCLQTINSTYNITYLGDHKFLVFCFGNSNGFVIDKSQLSNDNIGDILDFGQTNLTDIIGIASNAESLIAKNLNTFKKRKQIWNVLFLSNQSNSEIMFCNVEVRTSNLACSNYSDFFSEILILIDRAWTTDLVAQQSKWMEVDSQIRKLTSEFYIPGQINQFFISEGYNMYIQSIQNGQTYLNVFQDSGQFLGNITYHGTIVLYGSRNLLTFDKSEEIFERITVTRPILQINNRKNNSLSVESFTQKVECGANLLKISYEILWTSPFFPSAIIIPLNKDRNYMSKTQIFQFKINEEYLIIGPDFDIFVNNHPQIQSTKIQSNIFQIENAFRFAVGLELIEGNFLRIFFATDSEIFMMVIDSAESIIVSRSPCGFQNITTSEKIATNIYMIINSDGNACLCVDSFNQCVHINQNQKYETLLQSESRYNDNSLFKAYLDSSHTGILGQQVLIRKNIFSMYSLNYMISILTNNSILLIDTKSKQIISSYDIKCQQYNSTDGSIFMKESNDPALLMFCLNDKFIKQFIIHNSKLIFQREIPIYGYQIRGSDNPLLIGKNYAFLEVDDISDRQPPLKHCCILRLDPCQYTVSVIQQIIEARYLSYASSIKNFDVVIVSNTLLNNSGAVAKVYYGNVWIALNYSSNTSSYYNTEFQLIFQSFHYNFAAISASNITYNLEDLKLTKKGQISSQILLYSGINSEGNTFLSTSFSYNFSKICGPIFYSYAIQEEFQSFNNLEIYETDIITRTKMLGSIGIDIIQIILPSVYHLPLQNSSLNQLMILVGTSELYFYRIETDNNVSMQQIQQVQLSQRSCVYWIYEQNSLNSISLIGVCDTPNVKFQSPLITISYQNNQISIEQTSIYFKLKLYDLYTFLVPQSNPIIIGIQEGPVTYETGKLFICKSDICQNIYVSTKYAFLLDYDAMGSYDDFVVMTIDIEQIFVFKVKNLNLNTKLQPDFALNYTQITGVDYCSIINIIGKSGDDYITILSCSQFYYQIRMDLQKRTLTLKNKYARFSGCSRQDKFEVQAILNDDGQIEIMYTICNQNEAYLKLTSYQTIQSSIPIIYTGYLQIFTPNGPQCNEGAYSPIRIIPLSTSMNYPVFRSYLWQGKFKFIYSEINGRVFDNDVSLQPKIQITFSPLAKSYNMPNINFKIQNPYNQITKTLSTTLDIQNTSTVLQKIQFVLFCIFNLITLLFIICALMAQNWKNSTPQVQMARDSSVSGFSNYDAFKFMKAQQQIGITDVGPSKKSQRISEIQLFYIKNK